MAVMQADASGKIFTFNAQEARDNILLDRYQSLANLEAQRRQQGQAVGIGSVMSGLKGASGLIKPQGADTSYMPDADVSSFGDANFIGSPSEADFMNSSVGGINSGGDPFSGIDIPG